MMPETQKPPVADVEDSLYFETLVGHVSKISPGKKLVFRQEVNKLVLKYAYNEDNISSVETKKQQRSPK